MELENISITLQNSVGDTLYLQTVTVSPNPDLTLAAEAVEELPATEETAAETEVVDVDAVAEDSKLAANSNSSRSDEEDGETVEEEEALPSATSPPKI